MLDPDPVAPRGAVDEATPDQAGLLTEFMWRGKKAFNVNFILGRRRPKVKPLYRRIFCSSQQI